MKKIFAGLMIFGLLAGAVFAQTASNLIPPAALKAKTIAILNDTKSSSVSDGAIAALKAWGQYKLVDDPESADITLRFDKAREHQGQATPNSDANGKPTDYNYSMSFSSLIHMKAYLKDGDTPFYTTKTDESKNKAGIDCVGDFRNAWRVASQQH